MYHDYTTKQTLEALLPLNGQIVLQWLIYRMDNYPSIIYLYAHKILQWVHLQEQFAVVVVALVFLLLRHRLLGQFHPWTW